MPMIKEAHLWNKIMKAALAIPGVCIDRQVFLSSTFKDALPPEELSQVLELRPAVVIKRSVIDNLATRLIKYHTRAVTTLSTLTGLPGGPAILASIPTDLAQYYYHVFVLAQKLAYLYGFPDLREKDEKGKPQVTDDMMDMLTLFVGTMMGADIANKVLRDICLDITVQIAKKVPQQALTRSIYYPLVKQVAQHIGVDLSKNSVSKTIGKFIPIIGGIVSGTVTYATFYPGAQRLQKTLHKQMDLLGTESSEAKIQIPTDDIERLVVKALINMSLMNERDKEKKQNFILQYLQHTTLIDTEKKSFAEALREGHAFKVDFREFKDDPVCSTQLMRLLTEIINMSNKISINEKIYLHKIARELGYSTSDLEEFLQEK
ncbi:hypothetical protein HMPREF9332_01756 [Alloprevotella rava F0323]|uniref:Co-chaperone DjlA N-terminal domain-containing protein n=2 Tax=Alloprevotella rava TaxID=671218 RepID=G5GDV4_9BACT|nr:hypothetical protein HMPREF9332_01756 [Alloprevotella rava F0323]